MSKHVAVEGACQIETSAEKHDLDIDGAGSWVAAGALKVEPGSNIFVGGNAVELSAEMTWTYIGAANNTVPVTVPPEILALEAGETKLKDGGKNILCVGDEIVGQFGNKIFVKEVQSKLSTEMGSE